MNVKSSRQHLAPPYVQSSVRIFKPVLLLLALAGMAGAQAWDTSGNGLLKGSYYFRHTLWYTNSDGSLGEALVAYGSINFDGNGNYTTAASALDAANGTVSSNYNVSGTYHVAASGYGFLDGTLNSLFGGSVSGGDVVYG